MALIGYCILLRQQRKSRNPPIGAAPAASATASMVTSFATPLGFPHPGKKVKWVSKFYVV
jgi:hypothetical protein